MGSQRWTFDHEAQSLFDHARVSESLAGGIVMLHPLLL